MWVKICANTTLEDARAAADAGADAVGFVFAPSKRQVTPEQVRAISAALPAGVERVGVFAALPAVEIAAAAHYAGLTTVQLHGAFDVETSARLLELAPGIDVIQTVHWSLDANDAEQRVMQTLDRMKPGGRVLLDAKVAGVSGGLGVAFDWAAAGRVAAAHPALRVLLAGGLTPANVADAVRLVRPAGVDVASGVEREPGHKDHDKVRLFIENARRA